MKLRWILALSALAASNSASAANELCQRLKALETSKPYSADDPGERRWIEFHWGADNNPDSIWSLGCRSSKHQISKVTCDWLMQHTNQEFSMMLPQAIMACYGYRFPKFAFYDWNGVLGSIEMRSANGRRLILDMNYRDLPEGEEAMRLTVEQRGIGKKYTPETMPPIATMREPADSTK